MNSIRLKISILIAHLFVGSLFICADAQEVEKGDLTSKGRVLIGTSSAFSITGVSIEELDDQLLNLNLNVNGGYFVLNNLALGVVTGYEYTRLGEDSDWSYNIGAFARYYTKPKIFIGTGYLLSSTQGNDNLFGTIPVEIGYAYFINRTFALEPAILLGIGANNNSNFIYAFSLGFSIYLN